MAAAATAYPRDAEPLALVLQHGVVEHVDRALAAGASSIARVGFNDAGRRDFYRRIRGAARLQLLELAYFAL